MQYTRSAGMHEFYESRKGDMLVKVLQIEVFSRLNLSQWEEIDRIVRERIAVENRFRAKTMADWVAK